MNESRRDPMIARGRITVRGCAPLLVASALVLCALLPSIAFAAIDGPTYLGPKPPAQVKRVVTLAPSITEIVIALGAGDRLVGVSQFDTLDAVKSLPRVGGFVDPSVEAVLALKPDLLIVQPAPGNQAPVEKLAELGVPILALPMHTVAQTLQSMREVGKALGVPEKGEALCRDIEATREKVRAQAKAQKKVRVMMVYEWEPLIVAGPGSFADELLGDAGAANVVPKSDSPYPTWPVEAAVASRPELIIDAAHDPAPAQKLRNLTGLKEARWARIPNEDLMHPGPQLGRSVQELYLLIHPAAQGTAPSPQPSPEGRGGPAAPASGRSPERGGGTAPSPQASPEGTGK